MSKKEKIVKTNAMRLLEFAHVDHKTATYDVDPNDLSAVHVAQSVGEDVNCVYKTLVLHGEKVGYFVVVIAGDKTVNLKQAAQAAGCKKAEMIPMKDLLSVTGYIRGGCSPIGMKKPLPTFIDSAALKHEHIYISAGVRGMQIIISPEALARFIKATFVDQIAM